jgi:ribose transport system ATP-binding protein
MMDLLEVTGLTKAYAGVMCLDDVSLRGRAGSVHAVTGENGAGKSTLMKIIGGVVRPDKGSIRLRGAEVHFASPLDALRGGVSTVFQEFSLIENLTVAESLFLGHEPSTWYGALDRGRMMRAARRVLDEVGLDLDPRRFIASLTVAEQQMVEIARGVSANADVFVFDEPTAALGAEDVVKLKRLIRDLQAAGRLIFYISHRLDEIFDLCDTVTVLKDGRLVATRPVVGLDHDRLVAMMVGRNLEDYFPGAGTATSQPALRVTDLRRRNSSSPVSLAVNKGEIVGLAGLEGQGQREILRALAGAEPCAGVTMETFAAEGGVRRHDPARGVAAQVADGIVFIPEDRKKEGLYLSLAIDENMALGLYQRRGLGAVARSHGARVAEMMRMLRVKATSAAQPVGKLSGGNQQKVMLGRWLVSGARILLIEEPTRGVDVGAKAEIYAILRQFVAQDGGAILVMSREMNELIGLCDRILVIRDGGIVAGFAAGEATEESILRAAIADAPREPARRAS